jgi:hypothetical protein
MKKVRTSEEALRVFDYLGVKDVTKEWQKRKGTQVFELPFKTMYNDGSTEINRFTIYKNGYVRKMVVYGENNASKSCYQINKVRKVSEFVKDYDYNHETCEHTWNGKYRKIYGNVRVMVDTHKQRLVYLCNYILKNYYNNKKYSLVGDYTRLRVSEVHGKFWRQERENDQLPFYDGDEHDLVRTIQSEDTKHGISPNHKIQVIIDGHRYNLS